MAVKISSGYEETLSQIKHYLTAVRGGAFQEEITVGEAECYGKRRCYYNRCADKSVLADKVVVVIEDVGRKMKPSATVIPFHTDCLEKLLKDKYLDSLN